MGMQGRRMVEAQYSTQACFDMLYQHVLSQIRA